MREPLISNQAKKAFMDWIRAIRTTSDTVVDGHVDWKNDALKNAVKYAGRAGMVLAYMILWNAFSIKSWALGIVSIIILIIGAFIAKKN